eukprot:1264442-Prymnesium_polylepis.3
MDITPTYTARLLSERSCLRDPAACSASYPSSSSRRCCGSIVLASGTETLNAVLSNSSRSSKNAPYMGEALASASHRVAGL